MAAKRKDGRPAKPSVDFEKDPDRQELYLFHLAGGTNDVWPGWSGSAELAGVSYSTVKALRKRDPDFADREQAAYALYQDKLRREIDRRGRRGVLKAVFHQGARCGRERQYSDRLLLAQARAHLPEYKDKAEVDVNVTGSLALADLRKLDPESRELVRQLVKRQQERAAEGKEDGE